MNRIVNATDTNSNDAIVLKDVNKHYRTAATPFLRLKEIIFPNSVKNAREFVALENVSLTISKGECVGIIGPNGAGKSTLLKLIAGILKPSDGDVIVNGRISSIIELGSGFHPDFTGTENIILNASLHNIPQENVPSLLEEIRAFTHLGKYMDLPVKTYSSGMFVRLAFALAISVKPEILLIDEALAVGDAVFSYKCLRRITELHKSGVTIVFVSHDTGAVSQICTRSILIDHGKILADGETQNVVNLYLQKIAEELTNQNSSADDGKLAQHFHQIGASEVSSNNEIETRFGSFDTIITDMFMTDESGNNTTKFRAGDVAIIKMFVRFDVKIDKPIFGVMLKNRLGIEVFGTNTQLQKIDTGSYTPGQAIEVSFAIPLHIGGGSYAVSLAVHSVNGVYFDYRIDALVFEVVQSLKSGGTSHLPIKFDMESKELSDLSPVDKFSLAYHDAPETLYPVKEESIKFLAEQWYEVLEHERKSCRWVGKQAAAFVSLNDSKSIEIEFGSTYPLVKDKGLKVEFVINDVSIGDYLLKTNELVVKELSLPEELQNLKCVSKVEIRSDVWSPKDFGANDIRELSIFVYRIKTKA
ncbi:MAG: ABC transporter ATP-binding protein [Candidatus Sumerlaeales bacterium]|nr:ABC transporter ATP-binding protein [Candidatus Sumerlaeales bacterium]